MTQRSSNLHISLQEINNRHQETALLTGDCLQEKVKRILGEWRLFCLHSIRLGTSWGRYSESNDTKRFFKRLSACKGGQK